VNIVYRRITGLDTAAVADVCVFARNVFVFRPRCRRPLTSPLTTGAEGLRPLTAGAEGPLTTGAEGLGFGTQPVP